MAGLMPGKLNETNMKAKLFLCLIAAGFSYGVQAHAGVSSCDESKSTAESASCYSQQLVQAEHELKTAYKDFASSVSESSALDKKEIAEINKRLQASQANWIPYRNSGCSLESVSKLGSSEESAAFLKCKVNETISRTNILLRMAVATLSGE